MFRRALAGLGLACSLLAATASHAQADAASTGGDPFGSFQWPDLKREFLGATPVEFDARVQVLGPSFAEDPMNVPISVSVVGLPGVERITVLVDRNPIRKVLEYFPIASLPRVSFRFKLEQSSPVRVAAMTRDGVWHVGGTLVNSTGGGCTAPSATRRDDGWARSLGELSARTFARSAPAEGLGVGGVRLRLRVMHPMDTGLVGGVPAFYVNHLSLRDAAGRELMRLNSYEPVSENPVFSFDFAEAPPGPLQLVGTDNNGNRIGGAIR